MRRGAVSSFRDSNGKTTIAIATTAVVYTHSMKFNYADNFGLFLKAASSGTIALTIELQGSPVPPTTEGSSDTMYYTENNCFIVAGAVASSIALADANAILYTVTPIPMHYYRLKITGGGSNDATTTLDARAFLQEWI